MKYSFMTFSCPELGLDEVLSVAKGYGYDGIEPRIGSGHKHGIEFDTSGAERKEIKQKAIDSGIAFCCVATSCQYSRPDKAEQNVEDTLKSIDLAADVGAPAIRVFGGSIPKGLERADSFKLIVDSLRSVANHAKERSVTVCIETHDAWCDPRRLAEIVKTVDHPAIAANWDIMHPVQRGNATMDEAYEVLKPLIKHVHFHDGTRVDDKADFMPIGRGEVDHKRAIELLTADNYQGYMSGEWINWQSHDLHLPRELATMKDYEKQIAG